MKWISEMKTQIFVELLRESVLIQAAVTLIMVIGMVYMYAIGRDIPADYLSLLSLIIGFWFGSKTQAKIQKYLNVRNEE